MIRPGAVPWSGPLPSMAAMPSAMTKCAGIVAVDIEDAPVDSLPMENILRPAIERAGDGAVAAAGPWACTRIRRRHLAGAGLRLPTWSRKPELIGAKPPLLAGTQWCGRQPPNRKRTLPFDSRLSRTQVRLPPPPPK
jgi:hypothetical protein